METKNILIGLALLIGGYLIGSVVTGTAVSKTICNDPSICAHMTDLKK